MKVDVDGLSRSIVEIQMNPETLGDLRVFKNGNYVDSKQANLMFNFKAGSNL
jgi:hypothetical protein